MYTIIITKNYFKIILLFSPLHIRMNGNKINFDDKKSKKLQFQKNKKVFQIDNIDANKIIVSKKEPYIKNNSLIVHFNGYNDNYVIRPLCLRLPQITGYAKKFNKNATMFFKLIISSF